LNEVKELPLVVKSGLDPESRLERLVQSGRCEAVNSKEYRAELKALLSKETHGRDLRSEAAVFKSLSAEVRLKMIHILSAREMCECEIMVALELTQPTASHHLSSLERAGLVTSEKRGKWVFYKATEAARRRTLTNPVTGPEGLAHTKSKSTG